MANLGWLFDLLGYKRVRNSSNTEFPQRTIIRFMNGSVADNPTLGTTDVTPGGGGGGGGAVDSVFSRTGVVLAQVGDYLTSQITNNSSVSGSTLSNALNTLQAAIAGVGAGAVSSVFGRTGAVVAIANDYLASQVQNDSGVSGGNVKLALDNLKAAITNVGPDFGASQVLTTGGFLDTESGSGAERGFVSFQASADANGARFVGKKSRGTSGSPTAHAADDVLTGFVARGHDGSAFYQAGQVRFVGDAAGGTSKRARVEVLAHDGSSEVVLSKTVSIAPFVTAGATPTAIYTIAIPASTLSSLSFRVRGKDGSGNEVFREWTLVVRRVSTANVSQLGTNDLLSYRDDAGAGLPSIVVNATSIDLTVTGKAATSYTWTGEINWREL